MAKKLVSAAVLVALYGCGGSSDNPAPAPTPPQENRAPVAVADTSTTINNGKAIINVISNDTDADNNSLTISEITTEPTMGSVAIVDNKVEYTPNTGALGADSFEYQITDGKLTSKATVSISNTQSITLSGMITDNPIANAEVNITIGEQSFTTTANAKGEYELEATVNAPAMVQIKGTGIAANNQQNIELISRAKSFNELMTLAGENRTLSAEDARALNATQVSTAMYLMVKDLNNNEVPATAEQLAKLTPQVNPDDLLKAAGVIKLIIDNPKYQDLASAPLLSLLDANNELTTVELMEKMLEDSGISEEDIEQDLNAAISATVNDPNVTQSFNQALVSGKTIVEIAPEQPGYMQYSPAALVLNSNNSATISTRGYQEDNTITWNIDDNKLVLGASDATSGFPYFSAETIRTRFGDDVANALNDASNKGLLNCYFGCQIEQKFTREKVEYTLLALVDNTAKANRVESQLRTLVFPENVVAAYPVLKDITEREQTSSQVSLLIAPQSAVAAKTKQDIQGTWALPMLPQASETILKNNENNDFGFLYGQYTDKAVLAENDTVSFDFANNDLSWRWQFNDGKIVLSNSNGDKYEYTLIRNSKKLWHTLLKVYNKDNQLTSVSTNGMIKFDQQPVATDLVTTLPTAWLAGINFWLTDQWHNNKLKEDSVFGYQFNGDGTMLRGIYIDTEETAFNAQSDWTWQAEGTKQVLSRTTNLRFVRHRTWDQITTDDNGHRYVIEYENHQRDQNGNGVIDEDEKLRLWIYPRINFHMKQDLSQWSEAWKNRKFN